MENHVRTSTDNFNVPAWLRIAVIGRNFKMTLLRTAIWAVVCVVVFKVALVHVRVSGISMLPTCPEKSVYWVNRLAYFLREPCRGDVVAIRVIEARDPLSRLEPPDVMLLKRIIGLPGESVAFLNGQVMINGEILDEPYEKNGNGCLWNLPPVKLGPAEYYVVGDNRSMPPDSHTHGVCKRKLIVGKARV
jgi:signal peptidase I